MSLFDLLEECARLNFDAVDPTGYFFPAYPKVPEATSPLATRPNAMPMWPSPGSGSRLPLRWAPRFFASSPALRPRGMPGTDLLGDRKGGEIDMARLVWIIRESDYRGYVPIETLPTLEEEKNEGSYDAYARVPALLGKLRRALDGSSDGRS